MPASKSIGGAQDQSPTNSSSGYSSTPLDSSKPSSSATDSEKPSLLSQTTTNSMSPASGLSDQYHPSASGITPPGGGANGRLHYMDHTYHDLSCYLTNGGQIEEHKKSGSNFPAYLHQMLSEPRFANSITWMPHGRAWKILDKGLLVTEAIPPYFSLTKFESFTRQLSGWGFKRLHRQGPDIDCYYNESFLRGIPELTVSMRRVTPKQGKCAPHPEGEPDFYSISRSYPLPPTPVSMAHKESSPAVGTEATTIQPPQSLPHIQAHDWSVARSHNTMPTSQPLPKSLASASSEAVAMSPFTLMPPVPSSETVQTLAREASTRFLTSAAAPAQVAIYHLPQPYHQTRNEPQVQDPDQRRYLAATMPASSFMNYPPLNQTTSNSQDGSRHWPSLNQYHVDYLHASYPVNYASTPMAVSNNNAQYFGGTGYTSYPIQGHPQPSSQQVESRVSGAVRQANHEENTRQEEESRFNDEVDAFICFRDEVNAFIDDF